MPNTSGNTGVNWCTVAKIAFTIMVVVTVIFTILLLVLKGVIPTGSSSTGQEKILSSNSCGNNVNRTDIIISCKRLVELEGLNANSLNYKKCCLFSALQFCLIEEIANGRDCGDLPTDHGHLANAILGNATAQLGWSLTEAQENCPKLIVQEGIIYCQPPPSNVLYGFLKFTKFTGVLIIIFALLFLVPQINCKFICFFGYRPVVFSRVGSDAAGNAEGGGANLNGPPQIEMQPQLGSSLSV